MPIIYNTCNLQITATTLSSMALYTLPVPVDNYPVIIDSCSSLVATNLYLTNNDNAADTVVLDCPTAPTCTVTNTGSTSVIGYHGCNDAREYLEVTLSTGSWYLYVQQQLVAGIEDDPYVNVIINASCPTNSPTISPTNSPTDSPTYSPTESPTESP
eukprot:583311_1